MPIRHVIVAIAYFAAGWLGLQLPYAGAHITLVWLPTGIAVAALYRWGQGMWPAIALAAFAVNLTLNTNPVLAAGIALGNTLAPVLTSRLLRGVGFDGEFILRRQVLQFVMAACMGMLVSASGGVLALHLSGDLPPTAASTAWMSWWMGDVVGVILATPLLLLSTPEAKVYLREQAQEWALWLSVASVVGWFAFMHDYGAVNRSLPMAFLTLPLVAWAAMRLQRIGAAVAGMGFSVLAALGTGLGHGTFYLSDPQVGQFLLWSYMAVIMLTGMMIGAMHAERERVEATLLQSQERLNEAQQVAQLGNFEWDVVNDKLWWSDQHWRLWGREPDPKVPPTRLLYRQGIHPEDHEEAVADVNRALKTKTFFNSEYRVVWPDGSVHDLRSIGRVMLDERGRVSRLIGTMQEITEQKRISAEIRRSEIKFRTLYESISDAVMVLGEEGFTECNQAALTLFGCENKQHFFGLHPAQVSPPKQEDGSDSMASAQYYLARARREGTLRFEWLHKRIDNGHVFPAEVWLSAMELDGRSYVQGIVRDITERRQAEQRIQWLAFYDELTRLPNRRLATDRLGQALAVSRRNREQGAIMMLDLDNFKTLNDTQGHDAGDRLLIEAAKRIQAAVRPDDTVARFGGDEFVVLIEGLDADPVSAATHAELVAEKILAAFNAPFHVSAGNRVFRTTCSIGVTLFDGQMLSIDELIKQADVALYEAKDAGRNAVRFFSPEMQSMIESHSAMESAMHHGLHHNEFRLFYQPQVDQAGQLIGAEALLRWFPHDQDFPVSPAQFIPLAEETGLIVPIGQWVIQAACAQLQAWATDSQTSQLVLAINVSARQFRQPDFVRVIRENLRRHNVKPSLLKLELTESVVLDNIDEVIDRMMQIKALGVTFALDDFGTGFSSLSYLKKLPLDQVKIDQSFVRDVTTDPSDAAIVRAILAMSQSLGMQVIAEGVETPEQLSFLAEHGCAHYQGYLFGKPMAVEDWPKMDRARLTLLFK